MNKLKEFLRVIEGLSIPKEDMVAVRSDVERSEPHNFIDIYEILRKNSYYNEATEFLQIITGELPAEASIVVLLSNDLFDRGLIKDAYAQLQLVENLTKSHPLAQKLLLKINIIFSKELVVKVCFKRIRDFDLYDQETKDLLRIYQTKGFLALRTHLENLLCRDGISLDSYFEDVNVSNQDFVSQVLDSIEKDVVSQFVIMPLKDIGLTHSKNELHEIQVMKLKKLLRSLDENEVSVD